MNELVSFQSDLSASRYYERHSTEPVQNRKRNRTGKETGKEQMYGISTGCKDYNYYFDLRKWFIRKEVIKWEEH